MDGRGRGFRDVRLLDEMGMPYRLGDVDLLAGVENDEEFLRIDPAGFVAYGVRWLEDRFGPAARARP